MRYQTVTSRMVGDPGFLSGIGHFLGGALKTVGGIASMVPGVGGVVGTVANIAGGILSRPAAQPGGGVSTMPTVSNMMTSQALPASSGLRPGQRVTKGRTTIGVSPLGTVGIHTKKSRRMNVGNARAAHRAIRRIKGVRHLLRSIEREMPKVHVKAKRAFGRR